MNRQIWTIQPCHDHSENAGLTFKTIYNPKQNAIIKDQCIKYNPNDEQLSLINSQNNNSIQATYRSTIWTCDNKGELQQYVYLSDDCSGVSTTNTFNGCSSDNYKYYTNDC